MSLNVLIIPDKFKGTLTAQEAADAIARGWRTARPGDHLESLPMSDGGDGFGEILSSLLHARKQRIRTVDAAHRPCQARWWWESETRTAIIESAKVIGLARLPAGRFHPFELDTFGLGIVLRAAARKGACRCLVGIGGSATNDAGFGMARALGWGFLDRSGNAIDRWTGLHRLTQIVPPRKLISVPELVVAVDVQNPLLGACGCTRIYGPQKGLRAADFAEAERCLRRLAKVAAQGAQGDRVRMPGAGAAGGLGFGLSCFAGGTLEPGFQLFARQAKLLARLRDADLVITGEGAIDRSSLMGKGVGEIARACRRFEVPCLGLGGIIEYRKQAEKLFARVEPIAPALATPEQAKARPGLWLARLAARVAGEWR